MTTANMETLKPAPGEDEHDIIYSLRTVHQSQMQQNLMADQKANILIGLVIIIFTVLLTRLPQFGGFPDEILFSIFLFCVLELAGLLFALLVIIPKNVGLVRYKKPEDMKNPLFSGEFTCFSEEVYTSYLMAQMNNSRSAREMLIRDLYHIGKVLRKKFMMLKYAYAFAVSGIIFPFVFYLYVHLG